MLRDSSYCFVSFSVLSLLDGHGLGWFRLNWVQKRNLEVIYPIHNLVSFRSSCLSSVTHISFSQAKSWKLLTSEATKSLMCLNNKSTWLYRTQVQSGKLAENWENHLRVYSWSLVKTRAYFFSTMDNCFVKVFRWKFPLSIILLLLMNVTGFPSLLVIKCTLNSPNKSSFSFKICKAQNRESKFQTRHPS